MTGLEQHRGAGTLVVYTTSGGAGALVVYTTSGGAGALVVYTTSAPAPLCCTHRRFDIGHGMSVLASVARGTRANETAEIN